MTAPARADGGRALALRWEEADWDGPVAARLRERMDEELGPRYRGAFPDRGPIAPPTAAEIETTWVALVDEEPAATASLRRAEGYLEVKRLFVAPEHRRRGLARLALAQVEASARQRGARRLLLQTGVLQPDAIALYEREGWRRIPPYGPYIGDEVSVCFEKALD